MFRYLNDSHTDNKLNWIEESIHHVAQAFYGGMSEEDIIADLQLKNISEDMLSLLLTAGKIIYQDEINNYTGDE